MHTVCHTFQYNHASAGRNPELWTLLYCVASFLNIPAHAVFVFDGPSWPDVKWRKQVCAIPHWITMIFQEMLAVFGFIWYEVSDWQTNARQHLIQPVSPRLLVKLRLNWPPSLNMASLMLSWQQTLTQLSLVQPVSYAGKHFFSLIYIFSQSVSSSGSPEPPSHFDCVKGYTDHAIATATGMGHEDLILIAILSGGESAPDMHNMWTLLYRMEFCTVASRLLMESCSTGLAKSLSRHSWPSLRQTL